MRRSLRADWRSLRAGALLALVLAAGAARAEDRPADRDHRPARRQDLSRRDPALRDARQPRRVGSPPRSTPPSSRASSSPACSRCIERERLPGGHEEPVPRRRARRRTARTGARSTPTRWCRARSRRAPRACARRSGSTTSRAARRSCAASASRAATRTRAASARRSPTRSWAPSPACAASPTPSSPSSPNRGGSKEIFVMDADGGEPARRHAATARSPRSRTGIRAGTRSCTPAIATANRPVAVPASRAGRARPAASCRGLNGGRPIYRGVFDPNGRAPRDRDEHRRATPRSSRSSAAAAGCGASRGTARSTSRRAGRPTARSSPSSRIAPARRRST